MPLGTGDVRDVRVLLVAMPFGALRPAIGVSLLKAHLTALGATTRVEYLNLRFARRVGAADYRFVAEQAPSQSLGGDWVFSAALFGERPEADAAYFADYRERFPRSASFARAPAILRRCRTHVEPFLEAVLDGIAWGDYDVVGFTSTFTQHVAALALARRVKERFPELVLAFGGANCEGEMGLQLHRSFDFVDLVCSGEADLTFPLVVERLAAGGDLGSVPGLVSRDAARPMLSPRRVQDLDQLPHPDYGDYYEQVGAARKAGARTALVLMETSRGCWWGEKHHCTFCGLNGMSMAFRSKSAERALREILEQCERYDARFVEMVDNILDMRYFGDLLPELRRRELKVGLFYETKANLSKEQLRLLRDAGVASIQPGIESFSTDVLRIMRKGTSAAQNVQILKWCKELGIDVYWNLLYGFPGEDPDAYAETARIIDAVHHLAPPYGVGAIRLDRFSPNFVAAEELGLVDVRPDRSYACIYDLPQDELNGLAYYFEHAYADGRDPQDYMAAALDAVTRWHEESGTRGLVYADHGTSLGIWDFRKAAARTLTILEGHERELYLYCDRYRSRAQVDAFLAERGVGAAAAADLLERLDHERLMLEVDGRHLSLAVRTDDRAGEDVAESARELAAT